MINDNDLSPGSQAQILGLQSFFHHLNEQCCAVIGPQGGNAGGTMVVLSSGEILALPAENLHVVDMIPGDHVIIVDTYQQLDAKYRLKSGVLIQIDGPSVLVQVNMNGGIENFSLSSSGVVLIDPDDEQELQLQLHDAHAEALCFKEDTLQSKSPKLDKTDDAWFDRSELLHEKELRLKQVNDEGFCNCEPFMEEQEQHVVQIANSQQQSDAEASKLAGELRQQTVDAQEQCFRLRTELQEKSDELQFYRRTCSEAAEEHTQQVLSDEHAKWEARLEQEKQIHAEQFLQLSEARATTAAVTRQVVAKEQELQQLRHSNANALRSLDETWKAKLVRLEAAEDGQLDRSALNIEYETDEELRPSCSLMEERMCELQQELGSQAQESAQFQAEVQTLQAEKDSLRAEMASELRIRRMMGDTIKKERNNTVAELEQRVDQLVKNISGMERDHAAKLADQEVMINKSWQRREAGLQESFQTGKEDLKQECKATVSQLQRLVNQLTTRLREMESNHATQLSQQASLINESWRGRCAEMEKEMKEATGSGRRASTPTKYQRQKTLSRRSRSREFLFLPEDLDHGKYIRSKHRLLIIGPGFGHDLNQEQFAMLMKAGYSTMAIKCADPDAHGFNVSSHLGELKKVIGDFQPDCVLVASKSGAYMQALWQHNIWVGPSLVINAHPCLKIPPNVPVVLCHGSNDQLYRRSRQEVERLLHTGTRNMCFLYYTANSGVHPSGGYTRTGDEHVMQSLLTHDCLPRLIDAAISKNPEIDFMKSWPMQLVPEYSKAEKVLGLSPEEIKEKWTQDPPESQIYNDVPVCDVSPHSEEFRAVATMFRSLPVEEPTHKYADSAQTGRWNQTPILKILRVQNSAQLDGGFEPYYDQVKIAIEQVQGLEFQKGVHTRWVFHGTAAIEDIALNPIAGFLPSASGARGGTLWGAGTYFARDAKYVARAGFAVQKQDGHTRRMFLCLLICGVPCVGDPDNRGILPLRQGQCHYNSCVDSLNNPEIFVAQLSRAAYPAYVIEFI